MADQLADVFAIPEWKTLQHYTKRNPPWIKLHADWLNNYEFSAMNDAEQAALFKLFLVASRHDNQIPADTKWLKNRYGIKPKAIERLLLLGFLVNLSYQAIRT